MLRGKCYGQRIKDHESVQLIHTSMYWYHACGHQLLLQLSYLVAIHPWECHFLNSFIT